MLELRESQTEQLSTEVRYPPAPWHSVGQLWAGLFQSDTPAQLPAGLHPVLSPRWRVVTLIRYQIGTLRYDELIVGPLARRGAHVGVFVDFIWVDSETSLHGGREIWGVPKDMASFMWEDDTVYIADTQGPILAMTVKKGMSRLPPVWLTAPGIGRLNQYWTYTAPKMWACLGKADMEISDWSPRFECQIRPKPLVGMAAKPFRVTVPAPTLLH